MSLLRTTQPDVRDLVRQALDMLVPALPRRLPMKEYLHAIKHTRRALLEDTNGGLMAQHALHVMANNPTIFYPYRLQFLGTLVLTLNRYGTPNSSHNPSSDQKMVGVSLADLLIGWEVHRKDRLLHQQQQQQASASSSSGSAASGSLKRGLPPPSPVAPQQASSSSGAATAAAGGGGGAGGGGAVKRVKLEAPSSDGPEPMATDPPPPTTTAASPAAAPAAALVAAAATGSASAAPSQAATQAAAAAAAGKPPAAPSAAAAPGAAPGGGSSAAIAGAAAGSGSKSTSPNTPTSQGSGSGSSSSPQMDDETTLATSVQYVEVLLSFLVKVALLCAADSGKDPTQAKTSARCLQLLKNALHGLSHLNFRLPFFEKVRRRRAMRGRRTLLASRKD